VLHKFSSVVVRTVGGLISMLVGLMGVAKYIGYGIERRLRSQGHNVGRSAERKARRRTQGVGRGWAREGSRFPNGGVAFRLSCGQEEEGRKEMPALVPRLDTLVGRGGGCPPMFHGWAHSLKGNQ
jgi:hypothetical protein